MPARGAKKGKQGGGGQSAEQKAEVMLAQWTQRQIQELLQCTPEETGMATAQVLSMSTKELQAWCDSTLTPISPAEQKLDPDSRFFSRFVQKKAELGLMAGQSASTSGCHGGAAAAEDTASASAATDASGAAQKKKGRKFTKAMEQGKDGHEALLPVAQFCGCEARKHELLCNCQVCGKIVCAQEGMGPCFFCFTELSKAPIHTRQKKQKEGSAMEQKAYLETQREFLKAVAQRDRLLGYQAERARRTEVVDDQEDYFETSKSAWLDAKERKEAADKEELMDAERRLRHKKGGNFTVHLDLVSGMLEQGLKYSDSQKEKGKAQAPASQVDAAAAAAEEAESGNVFMDGNVYIPEPKGPVAVRAGADGAAAAGESGSEDGHSEGPLAVPGGVRVLANPDAHAIIQYHPGAKLQQAAEERLMELGQGEIEARRLCDRVQRAGSYADIQRWADDVAQQVQDPSFADWVRQQAEALGLNKPKRWEKVGVAGEQGQVSRAAREARAEGLAKPDLGVVERSTGRIQTSWDADVDADDAEGARRKPVKRVPRAVWVKVNSEEARRRDAASRVRTGSSVCLSMHQPWASLLVTGIKKHEGRTWETQHRGRLWIHAASHQPSDEDIRDTENFYRSRGATVFPTHYPTSALLGCVTVDDCLPAEVYRKKLPVAEQESQSEWVFLCSNPQMLILPLPMDGDHKIFPLKKTILDSARRQAGREM